MSSEQYVVSDENGHYVAYTSDLSEANSIVSEGNQSLAESDSDGSYAIGMKTSDGYTFDCL